MVVIYHSLEACSILLLGHNIMWDEQSSVVSSINTCWHSVIWG